MVEMLDPKPDEMVGDPACGTAGFLVGTMQYLLEKYTSPKGILTGDSGERIYTGDRLEPYRDHIQNEMFHGFDFDVTMLRIASMNLMLHGVDNPDIHYQDTLSNSFPERFSKQATGAFDVVLANPPFKGSLDESDVHPSLTSVVKTKKTEVLFVALVLRMLKKGGRSATIVPDGVVFQSSKAHAELRRVLVEENQLEAVISLPSGVFRPDALECWKKRSPKRDSDRSQKNFMVSAKELRARDFDLSIKRYQESVREERNHEPPTAIVERMKKLEGEILADLKDLESML